VAKPPEVPDLDLPAAPSRRPQTPSQQRDDSDAFGDDGIVRGEESVSPSSAGGTPHRKKAISVDLGYRDDDDGDQIERGGGSDMSPPSGARPISSRAPVASMNLELAYQRPGIGPASSSEPSGLERFGGRALALAGIAAAVGPLLNWVHHTGKWSVLALAPHAFDATSLVGSGVFGGIFLVTSIAIGYLGIRARPRSWGMMASGVVLLIALLLMVTIALVATDESPQPPDAARLVPYVVPLGAILLGLGIAGRGQEPYLDGGARRALPFVFGLAGGLVIYAGIALSNY
jgi:hypothetical protein